MRNEAPASGLETSLKFPFKLTTTCVKSVFWSEDEVRLHYRLQMTKMSSVGSFLASLLCKGRK